MIRRRILYRLLRYYRGTLSGAISRVRVLRACCCSASAYRVAGSYSGWAMDGAARCQQTRARVRGVVARHRLRLIRVYRSTFVTAVWWRERAALRSGDAVLAIMRASLPVHVCLV